MIVRGDQRERDRARAQARNGGKGSKGKDDGLTPEQRRERDAKALQEKAAQAAGGESSGGNGREQSQKLSNGGRKGFIGWVSSLNS